MKKIINCLFFILALFIFSSISPRVSFADDSYPIPLYPGATLRSIDNFPNPRLEGGIWGILYYVAGNKINDIINFYKSRAVKQGLPDLKADGPKESDVCMGEGGKYEPDIIASVYDGQNTQSSIIVLDFDYIPLKTCYGESTLNSEVYMNGKTKVSLTYDLNKKSMVQTPTQNPLSQKTNQCFYSPDEEQKRQEILQELKTKFNFTVRDSNMCEKPSCVNNAPWSVEELTTVRDILNDMPSCFLKNLSTYKGITGIWEGGDTDFEKTISKWAGEACCKYNCSFASTFSLGYDRTYFCGDQYKNPKCKSPDLMPEILSNFFLSLFC